MISVAVDIGTYSIKAISSKSKNNSLEVDRVVEVPNPLGISVAMDEVSKEKMAAAIESMFADNSLPVDDVRLALPESIVSTKVIQVPVLSDAELASAIGWQAEQFIPIPKDELSLEYQVLFRPDKADRDTPMRVLLIGAKKAVIENFTDIFTMIGIEPSFIETQTMAIWRVLQPQSSDPPSAVANIGLSTMDISIERAGELAFVFSHPQGGMLLTRAVENMLALPIQQAEEYKRTYGLDPQYFEGKVQAAMEPITRAMVDHIQKSVQFFSTQYPQEAVQRVYLSGGSSQLPGLVPYAASILGVEVLMVNPFNNLGGAIPTVNQPAYTVCVGMLMRS